MPFLYLAAIILSFFLSLLLLTKKNKSHADKILSAWLVVTGIHLLTFYIFFTEQYFNYTLIVALGFPLPLAQGPFLYLYTCQQTTSLPFNWKQLLHFIPLLLSYILFSSFYFLPEEQRAEVFRMKGRGFELHTGINVIAIYISGVVYVILSLRRLLRYRKKILYQFSNTEKINFNWLLYLIIWMAVIWIVILFIQGDQFIFSAAALFILWLGYFGIKQVQVFSQTAPKFAPETRNSEVNKADDPPEEIFEVDIPSEQTGIKYQKSSLTEENINRIHNKLKTILEEQKPFTNPELTLNELARSLDIHPNHLSQVINSRENKNFYDLINEKRVKEFLDLVANPGNKQFTLLALAFDCGFNSKASFNRNFKKYTGFSPSEYLKQKT